MATPITWRNVDAPQLGGVFQGLALANQSINGGFDKLNEVIKQRTAMDEANWQNQKTNNTQAFLDEIAKYRTPEELAAAQASGALAQLRQGFGAQVDQSAIRNAEDGREAILQNRVKTGIDFKNTVDDSKDAPILDRISALTAQGKHTEAKALASDLLRNQGKAQKLISDTERSDTVFGQNNVLFGQKLTEEERKASMHPLDLALKRADITYRGALSNQANAAAEKYREGDSKDSKGSGKVSREAYEEFKKNNVYGEGSYDTPEGMKQLTDFLSSQKVSKGDMSDILDNISDLSKKLKKPIPVSEIKLAIAQSEDSWYTAGWSNMGNQVADILQTKMKANPKFYTDEHDGMEQVRANRIIPALSKSESVPASTLDKAVKRRSVFTPDDEEEAEIVNPILNNPARMAAERNRIRNSTSNLPDSVKRRLGITD